MYPAAAKSGARNRKVTSSSSENATPAAAARLAVDDSHRAEAVKDCIHFMNNISTVPRSNSLSCKP
nr:josephin-like protein [Ipomoea batatas]GMD69281.1 josephin-like protein [Ipomoea batatas]